MQLSLFAIFWVRTEMSFMNIEIANRLQKLRKENGYSQEELADKLGISRQAVSKWERAESSPDTDNLIILARLYNMSLDELLYDTESSDDIRQRTKDSICLTDDEGQSVIFKDGSIEFKNPDGTNAYIDKRRIILSIIDAIVFAMTLIAYFIWSAVFDAWYVSWVLWVLMPAIMSLFEACIFKTISKFLYPLLVTAIYCFIVMEFELWHPYWFLFVTIPLFYAIANPIDKFVFKTKKIEKDDIE